MNSHWGKTSYLDLRTPIIVNLGSASTKGGCAWYVIGIISSGGIIALSARAPPSAPSPHSFASQGVSIVAIDMSGDITVFDLVPFIQLLNKACSPSARQPRRRGYEPEQHYAGA